MKAVAALSPGVVDCVDVPAPPFEDYECLVKVRGCGLCGTDMKIIDNHLGAQDIAYPVILGHEGVGQVVETGPAVKYIEVGDLFAGVIGRVAPEAPYGRMWAHMQEFAVIQDHRAMDELGLDESLRQGAWIRRLPPTISPLDATVLLTLKEAHSALTNFGFRAGMDALVYGDGPVGLSLARLLRTRGAGALACVGHHEDRLERIARVVDDVLLVNSHEQEVEVAVGEQRYDLVIDAVGSGAVITEGSQLLKRGGKVGAYGVLSEQKAQLSLLDLKNNTCVHMLNWPHGEHDVHDEIVQMVLEGKIEPGDFYSHVIAAEDCAQAVRLNRSREAFRVAITF